MPRVIILLLLMLLSSAALNGQVRSHKGVPFLKNFAPGDYGHAGKIWDMDQAPNGLMYMASDKGLLEYDGSTWRSFKGSQGIIREVRVASDTLIYTGSDRDFGVWKPDSNRGFTYRSLYTFKDDLNRINEEFWDIHSIDNYIFFVSAENIYAYDGDQITKIPGPATIESSFEVDEQIYFTGSDKRLYQLVNLAPQALLEVDLLQDAELAGIFSEEDALMLVSKNSGILKFDGRSAAPIEYEVSEALRSANVFSFTELRDGYRAYGSILDGLYITDRDGRVIHHISKIKGLPNNTILSLFQNHSGKLWMGLDYGVSYVDLRDDLSFFYDYRGEFGTAYSALLESNEFYLGSNQGLYRSSWSAMDNSGPPVDWELISGSEGQVWTLKKLFGSIWMGHDRGLFQLNNDRISPIDRRIGILSLVPYENKLLAGTYNGVAVYEQGNSGWTYEKQIAEILGACDQIMIEKENVLWVNIPNYGVIRAELDEEPELTGKEIYLSEIFGGEEHSIRLGEEGVEVLAGEDVYRFDTLENTWRQSGKRDRSPLIDNLFLQNIPPVLLNDSYVFLPVYNGFALQKTGVDTVAKDPGEILIREAEAYNNQNLLKVYQDEEVPFKLNNIRLRAIVPDRDEVRYQFRVNDGEWSEAGYSNEYELIGLSHGDYTFSVRASSGGSITQVQTFRMSIKPPWFLSWWAYLIYSIIVISGIYGLYIWQGLTLKSQRKSLLREHRDFLKKQEDRHKKEMKVIEEEKLQAEYEQVKTQLRSKTVELATKAKENEEKNRILLKLQEKMKKLHQNPEAAAPIARELQQIIDGYLNTEDNTFEIQMDELHQEFFKNLRKSYDDLTQYDLRLCAYLKMGFDSKEIADLLNIKPSSVYISRSRLRKKLDMDTDDDLHAFLNRI